MNGAVPERARELWLASKGTATPREIVQALDREGMKATENIVRAWKSRHRWLVPSRAAAVRMAKREAGLKVKGHVDQSAESIRKLAEDAHELAEAATDDQVDPDELFEVESVARLSRMQNVLGRMLAKTGRAFSLKVNEIEISTSAELLEMARAGALLADAFGRLEAVLVEARKSRFTAVDDLGKQISGELIPPNKPEQAREPERPLLADVMRALETQGPL